MPQRRHAKVFSECCFVWYDPPVREIASKQMPLGVWNVVWVVVLVVWWWWWWWRWWRSGRGVVVVMMVGGWWWCCRWYAVRL
jgi:hypothetical protein